MILLGFAVRRWMHLGDHFWTGLEKLVYSILFPAFLAHRLVGDGRRHDPRLSGTLHFHNAAIGLRQLGLHGLYYEGAVLFAALPTAASSAYILAMRMGGDGANAAGLIFASTPMLTLPFWAAWLAA